jgi:hypothetical protein
MFALAVAAAVAAGWLVRTFDPAEHSFFPPCWLNRLTGLHCPGCGGTRAAHALLRGDVIGAVRFNALLVVGLPLFLLVFWKQLRAERRGAPGMRYLAHVSAICLILFALARNIPSPETSPFAPPKSHRMTPREPSHNNEPGAAPRHGSA